MHATLVIASLVLSQSVQVRTLPPADARAKEPVTAAFDIEELSDGRVLVSDNREKSLLLIDFVHSRTDRLGRNGGGPKEYQNVFTILRGAGDTLRVTDSGQQRYVVVSPAGSIVRTEPMPSTLFSLGSYSPVQEDARGRLYMAVMELKERRADGNLKIPDHSTIYRYDPGATSLVNLGTLRRFAPQQERNGVVPFPMRDAWALAPDGRIGVVAAADYHVEWIDNGRVVAKGMPVPYRPVKIDDGERDAWLDDFASHPAGSAQLKGAAPTQRGSRDPEVRHRIPDSAFPEFKPPFETEFAPIDRLGRIWVTESGSHNDSSLRAAVFDGKGKMILRVTLPPHTHIIGFGKSHVYLARTDDDDLNWIERYPLTF